MAHVAPDEDMVAFRHQFRAAFAAVHANWFAASNRVNGVATSAVEQDAESDDPDQNRNGLQQSSAHCDCSLLTGRDRDTCEGRGREGRPDPSRAAFRAWHMKYCPEGVYVNRRLPRGLGTTVESVLKRTKLHGRITAFLKNFGISQCGCVRRRVWLDRVIPYDKSIWLSRIQWLWKAVTRA